MATTPPRVALISLEPWDEIWRRNQHLAHQLVAQELLQSLTFVAPPRADPRPAFQPESRIRVIEPPLRVAPKFGGLRLAANWIRTVALQDVDALWINDASLGVKLVDSRPAWYDVTDDWRETPQGVGTRARLLRAEAKLATSVTTIVCSAELARRWQERYGVAATVVRNGVDLDAFEAAQPEQLTGPPPHVGYIGTLHEDRLDIDLVCKLAGNPGTVHLIGPDALTVGSRARLDSAGVLRQGSVSHERVPGLMKSFDVLIAPHRVTPFTLSLDAIKAYEYQAAGVPIVATPTSGFQLMRPDERVAVAEAADFVSAVRESAGLGPTLGSIDRQWGWESRAREFAAAVGLT